MARAKADQVLQLKVTLAEVEPVVWRRLLVPAAMTVAKLHSALQAAMGCGFRPSRSAIPADADHLFRQGDHPGRDAAG